MESEDLREIRDFFERAEREPHPEAKLPLLAEAVEAVAAFVTDDGTESSEINVARNLYASYMRRAMRQVAPDPRLRYFTNLEYLKLLPDPRSKAFGFLYQDPELTEAGHQLMERARAQSPRDGL